MRLAVADENRAVLVHEHAVRPSQLAFERITVRPIAACAGAGDQMNRARAYVNPPNCVVLRVGNVNIPVRPNTQPFRAVERRGLCGTTVAGETLAPSSS